MSHAMEADPVPLTSTKDGVASSTKVRLSGPTVSSSAALCMLPMPAAPLLAPSSMLELLQPRAEHSTSAQARPAGDVATMK